MTDIEIREIAWGTPLMAKALELRNEVFVIEQGVPAEIEIDEHDPTALHLVALLGEEVVGTLRILAEGRTARIGRMVIRKDQRGQGIGLRLMQHAGERVLADGFAEIVLHAQLQALPFYARLGYREEGDIFDDGGIPHITCRKAF